MTASGTNRTKRAGLMMSGRPEVKFEGREDHF